MGAPIEKQTSSATVTVPQLLWIIVLATFLVWLVGRLASTGHPLSLTRVVGFSQDESKLLLLAGWPQQLVICDRATHEVITPQRAGRVWEYDLSRGGNAVALVSQLGEVFVADTSTGAAVRIPCDRAQSAGIAADGSLVAVITRGGRLQIFDVTADPPDRFADLAGSGRICVAWSPTGRNLASGERDGSVVIHEVDGGNRLSDAARRFSSAAVENVVDLLWLDSKSLLVARESGVEVVDVRDGQSLWWEPRPGGVQWAYVVDDAGTSVAFYGNGPTQVYEAASGKQLREHPLHWGYAHALTLDSKLAAVIVEDRRGVLLHDVMAQTQVEITLPGLRSGPSPPLASTAAVFVLWFLVWLFLDRRGRRPIPARRWTPGLTLLQLLITLPIYGYNRSTLWTEPTKQIVGLLVGVSIAGCWFLGRTMHRGDRRANWQRILVVLTILFWGSALLLAAVMKVEQRW